MAAETIKTPLLDLLGIKYPIILAGMNVAAGPQLAAAVSNAGGLGMIGGVYYPPNVLREMLDDLKAGLVDKSLPFGVDLLLPQVGGNARKTNTDYTKGQLPELLDVVIESGAKLFVSAVGIPPKWAVEKLHAAGILVMNMVGSPKHVPKALEAGVDLICAQGGEGGGHTGEVATSILIPAVVDLCKGRKSSLHGGPVHVIAAGGIHDGRGLAMALALGAQAVWVGTRFVASEEGDAPQAHKDSVVIAGHHDTVRTLVFTGRPCRIMKNPYVMNWEENRVQEMKEALAQGKLPWSNDEDKGWTPEERKAATPWLMGAVAGSINSIKPAAAIVDEMMAGAISTMRANAGLVAPASKL